MIALWTKDNHVTLFGDDELICFRVSREQAIEVITRRGYSGVFANNTLDHGISAVAWKQMLDHHAKTFRDERIAALEDELRRLKARREAS